MTEIPENEGKKEENGVNLGEIPVINEKTYLYFIIFLVILVLTAAILLPFLAYKIDTLTFQVANLTQNCIFVEPYTETGGVPTWNFTSTTR